MPVEGAFKKKLAKLHFSYTTNKYVNLPFKWIWYRSFLRHLKLEERTSDQVCILMYDHNVLGNEHKFLKYLRKKFPGIKLAYIFTNIVKLTGAQEKNYVHRLNDWYDVVLAFDMEDATRYNFTYCPLIYDADPSVTIEAVSNDAKKVFYLGQAKDRMEVLLSVYEKLKELNIESDFHIANVPKAQMRYEDEITYNQYMTYDEAVRGIAESFCLVDVIQGESTGLTIKTCEAVCYGKKLLTTNEHVVEYPFYDPRYIRVVRDVNDIDREFFENNTQVDYPEAGKNYFSADLFWDRLWTILEKK